MMTSSSLPPLPTTESRQAAEPCDLSIIIVSWNVWELLRACLISIERATRPTEQPHRRALVAPEANLPPAGLRSIPAQRPVPVPARPNRGWPLSQPVSQTPQSRPVARPQEAVAGYGVEVIVVDNASSDGTVANLTSHFPWVRIIANTDNAGFTRANNQGYAISGGRFVYFLNPDTELEYDRQHGGSLFVLLNALAQSEGVAVAGPQLRYADNSLQSSARRFPTPMTGFFESTWLGRAFPLNPWTRSLHMEDWSARWSYDVDWVVGAAMLCRREALQAVMVRMESGDPWPWDGPFDERFFMYSEETDLCRRLKQAGWRIIHVPQARVIHFEGRSSEQAVTARHIHFNRSKVLYWHKWFGAGWAEALRRYLLLEYRVQIVVEGVKWLGGHRRALRRQRIDAYRQILATRLREAA